MWLNLPTVLLVIVSEYVDNVTYDAILDWIDQDDSVMRITESNVTIDMSDVIAYQNGMAARLADKQVTKSVFHAEAFRQRRLAQIPTDRLDTLLNLHDHVEAAISICQQKAEQQIANLELTADVVKLLTDMDFEGALVSLLPKEMPTLCGLQDSRERLSQHLFSEIFGSALNTYRPATSATSITGVTTCNVAIGQNAYTATTNNTGNIVIGANYPYCINNISNNSYGVYTNW